MPRHSWLVFAFFLGATFSRTNETDLLHWAQPARCWTDSGGTGYSRMLAHGTDRSDGERPGRQK